MRPTPSPPTKNFSDVTVVIQNFYECRQKHWPQIFNALESAGIPQEQMLVWNNHDEWYFPATYRGRLVESSFNTLLGRYAACLVADTPYVFVQDNDLTVGPETIAALYRQAQLWPWRIIGVAGCLLNRDSDRPYFNAQWVREGFADVILGRCWMAHRLALAPGISYILKENINPGRADDILFSMCASGGYVVPATITNLDEEGVGLSHEPDHFKERDAMALRMLGR